MLLTQPLHYVERAGPCRAAPDLRTTEFIYDDISSFRLTYDYS